MLVNSKSSLLGIFKGVSRFLSTNNALKEEIIKVGDYNINYLKIGNGSHTVCCFPGALGTIWTDFKYQVEGLNRDKFTVVVWDPPGYGKSRPPEKVFDSYFYHKDADIAHEFIKALKIPKYSIMGWSGGGITGIIHAAKYPDAVTKLVVWGSNTYVLPSEIKWYKKIKDIQTWSNQMKAPMVAVYGEELLAKYWAGWVDGTEKFSKTNNGNICSDFLKDIKCPTFAMYGEKDPMVDPVHIKHLQEQIKDIRIHLYPEGKHNIHIKYHEDFNKRVEHFLLEP